MQCFNHLPAPARWTQGAFKGIGSQKRRRRTPEKISLSTPPLLTHLVKNSHLPFSRLLPPTQRKTRTTNEISDVAKDKNRVVAPTPLPQLSISFLRRKRRTLPKLSTITVIGKDITPTSILGI